MILLEKETYAIKGTIFEVYRELGAGFLEDVYQESLAIEFKSRGILFAAQERIGLAYKGIPLRQVYVPDFICFNQVIVELKVVAKILPEHEAQVLNYLKATGCRVDFLVNFNHVPKVEIRRFVW